MKRQLYGLKVEITIDVAKVILAIGALIAVLR